MAKTIGRSGGGGAQASGSNPRTATEDTARAATFTHPRYDQWIDDWIGLGHVYEGDGPYLTGQALIPHSREYTYARDAEGKTDFSVVTGTTRKYRQRQTLARYENFASVIIDGVVDHQFGKPPARSIKARGVLGHHPLERFWEDVDGDGTAMDEWLAHAATLAHVYGHVFVFMDRLESVEAALSGRFPKVRTRAQQSRPVLRLYVPPDVPDWLAPAGQLSAVKFKEMGERKSLVRPAEAPREEYLIVDRQGWQRFDPKGRRLGGASHGFGVLPVLVFRMRRRARIPIIGRPTLRDYRLFRDHYNLISELREIFRNQCFSMLNIQLGEGETVEAARSKIGDHAGTDAILFSSNGAKFIAPPDGPIQALADEIHRVETKAFRLIGASYDRDPKQGVSEGTARIQAMDLNRLLTHCADQTELLEYRIAALWAAQEYGPARALDELDRDDLVIQHPEEFYTEQLAEVVADATATISLGMGPTATALIKQRVLHVALRDASREQIGQMEVEIAERAEYDAVEAELIADAAQRSGRPGTNPAGQTAETVLGEGAGTAGKGTDPNNTGAGGRSPDPRATPARPAAGTRRTDPKRSDPGAPVRSVADLRRRHKPLGSN